MTAEEKRAYEKIRYAKHREKRKELSRRVYVKNKATRNPYLKKLHSEAKRKVIAAYGSQCACCGEANPNFLTLDHKNNDGYTHRKRKGLGGTGMYKQLEKEGWPDYIQLMCWNCNCGRAHQPDKICPHQKTQRTWPFIPEAEQFA